MARSAALVAVGLMSASCSGSDDGGGLAPPDDPVVEPTGPAQEVDDEAAHRVAELDGSAPLDLWAPPVQPGIADSIPHLLVALTAPGVDANTARESVLATGAEIVGFDRPTGIVQIWTADQSEDVAASLAADPIITAVDQEWFFTVSGSGRAPARLFEPRALAAGPKDRWVQSTSGFIDVPDEVRESAQSRVAVLDIEFVHPYEDVQSRSIHFAGPERPPPDLNNTGRALHATSVARLACGAKKGSKDAETGMMPGCQVDSYSMRELERPIEEAGGGQASTSQVAGSRLLYGFHRIAESHEVVNMSVGTDIDDRADCPKTNPRQFDAGLLRSRIEALPVVFVKSAGNEGCRYPPAFEALFEGLDNVIIVGSIDHDEKMSDFSNFGDWVDVAAPGGDFDGWGIPAVEHCEARTCETDKRAGNLICRTIGYGNRSHAPGRARRDPSPLEIKGLVTSSGRHVAGARWSSVHQVGLVPDIPLLDAGRALRDKRSIQGPPAPIRTTTTTSPSQPSSTDLSPAMKAALSDMGGTQVFGIPDVKWKATCRRTGSTSGS